MRKSSIAAVFDADVQTVWEIVTNNEDVDWRSDLDRIEILSGVQFAEYTKNGHSTVFTITSKIPCERYEFDMANKQFTGHWIGLFSETESGKAHIDFTEELLLPDSLTEFLSYFFMNLKKQQKRYVRDLRIKLNEK